MLDYYVALVAHLLGAAVWVGGHLVLAIGILPRALREHRAEPVSAFESRFEPIGMPALAVQVVSGLYLAHELLGPPTDWFDSNPTTRGVQVKLLLLALTVALALHARFRVIPRLTDDTLPTLAWHIVAVTVLAVLFVVVGASIDVGGYPWFDR